MLNQLDNKKLEYAKKTLSAYAFYYLVGDALSRHQSISVVRMGDGEHDLMNLCVNAEADGYASDKVSYETQEWRIRLGIEGITYRDLNIRLKNAANACSHFAPNISGLTNEHFNLYEMFSPRQFYLDNFFVNIWNNDYKYHLFKKAEHVLFIHRTIQTADAMQLRAKKFGVKVSFIQMKDWRDSDDVIKKASSNSAPLVLFSGGPANKYISSRIAGTSKVVLDIGNAADHWTFLNYESKK